MRTPIKLALLSLTLLLAASTAWATLMEVRVDAVFDAAGLPLTDPLAISPDGKLAFIPEGGSVTFGVYIDLTGVSVNGLGAYGVSLLTGATPLHDQGLLVPAPIDSPGRERYGVTHLAGTYTYDLTGSTPYTGVSDTWGVLTGSMALKPDDTPLYPMNNFTTLLPPDLYDLTSGGAAAPQSPAVVLDDVGTDFVAVGGVQGSKVTNKASGGANKAFVPGLATQGGVLNIPTGGAYGNGAFKGPMEEVQMTFTALPRGQEPPGARSVQVNAFFTDQLFTNGGAEVAQMTNTSNSTTNSVNGELLLDPMGIGAPVMIIVGTGMVPEPGTMVMLLSGAVGLVFLRRRLF
jgi:hypothetical protein